MAQLRERWESVVLSGLMVASLLLGGCATAASHAGDGAALTDTPHLVAFVGVQDVFGRNAIGDAIVITAVYGTADRIAIGNTYRIEGAYTLASHDEARLSAYETDTQPNLPHRAMIAGQSVTVQKGSGTFVLYLKVEDPGCPHVSFYPTSWGQSFAGEYFGTGEFVPPESWRVGSGLAKR